MSQRAEVLKIFASLVIVVCSFSTLKFYSHEHMTARAMAKVVGLDFEVFGTVQGVFFRKYTQKRGEELGLKGWCMNTEKGTVVGRIEGEKTQVEKMKDWLRYTGSPQSAIDKAEFHNEQEIAEPSFPNFSIRK